MKKIWKYLVEHLRQDAHPGHYSVTALFLAACLLFNYSVDFEDSFLDAQTGFRKFLYFFLWFSFAYYPILLSYSCFKRTWDFWHNKNFWIKSILGLSLLSLDNSVPFLRPAIQAVDVPELSLWLYKVSVNLLSIFLVMLPLLIYYRLYDRNEKHTYGLWTRRFDAQPYFIMLAIMIPVLAAASFHPSFIRQYPMYKGGQAAAFLNVPEYITAGIYEIAYGLDFVTVEFFFRGFLIIGMMSILGRQSVLAMASVYCFLHFGKPAGEAISSIFGGYILGVVAYETRSIWGGIIVHVGIAWTMELMGYLHKEF